ncbi:hypothetical protein GGGNBK_15605 [Sporosarcina sp. ANT_H38]
MIKVAYILFIEKLFTTIYRGEDARNYDIYIFRVI